MTTTLKPNITDIFQQVGSIHALVAVGVIVGPEKWDYISNGLLCNSLKGGLKRASLEPISCDYIYCGHKNTQTFLVPWEQRHVFAGNLKEMLGELRLLEHAVIAVMDADWHFHIVHGDNLMGERFVDFFLRPEYVAWFRTETTARAQRSKAFYEEWKREHLAEKERRARETGEGNNLQ